eukprot:TRINITY_DN8834_c0_g1_i1.p1 TRINITY_DN8834_c0_g1~~TRINITY_DN8834_c0_g1_i1.p1  ORF type:complete len:201 (+),score=58.23 TRINITY_DN8834_c0_g1_i1:3-605(+)
MLSTQAHLLDKENQIGSISAKNVQAQKASFQQGPVKQGGRSFGVDLKQNNAARAPNPQQSIKKGLSSKVLGERKALGEIKNGSAAPKGSGKQKIGTKSSSLAEKFPRVDENAPIDYAYLPEPEIPYTDEYVEAFSLKTLLQLPAFIPMESGSFLLEEEPHEPYDIVPPAYEEQILDESDFLSFGDQMLPLSIEDLNLEDL